MKKILFGLLVALTTLSAYGQNSVKDVNVLVTHNLSTQRMVWSDSQNEYMFFDLAERYTEHNVFLSDFNNDGSGYIKLIRVESSDVYEFTVYNYETRSNDKGDYIWIDAIQIVDSQKVTFIIQELGEKNKMLTLFMPESKLVIYFDDELFNN